MKASWHPAQSQTGTAHLAILVFKSQQGTLTANKQLKHQWSSSAAGYLQGHTAAVTPKEEGEKRRVRTLRRLGTL